MNAAALIENAYAPATSLLAAIDNVTNLGLRRPPTSSGTPAIAEDRELHAARLNQSIDDLSSAYKAFVRGFEAIPREMLERSLAALGEKFVLEEVGGGPFAYHYLRGHVPALLRWGREIAILWTQSVSTLKDLEHIRHEYNKRFKDRPIPRSEWEAIRNRLIIERSQFVRDHIPLNAVAKIAKVDTPKKKPGPKGAKRNQYEKEALEMRAKDRKHHEIDAYMIGKKAVRSNGKKWEFHDTEKLEGAERAVKCRKKAKNRDESNS